MAINKIPFFKESTKKNNEDFPIMDMKVISFVVNEFPENGEDIKMALQNLKDVLEKSIDSIEDKSSDIIKKNRNFELSDTYRQNSIRLHEISQSVQKYISWMGENQQVNEALSDNGQDINTVTEAEITPIIEEVDSQVEVKEEVEVKENDTKGNNSETAISSHDSQTVDVKLLNIYEDFTGKKVVGFKLENHEVYVEDWDGLVVKTAEILTKSYNNLRGNKIEDRKPGKQKSSHENISRDTVWEIINEYGITGSKFKIYVQ